MAESRIGRAGVIIASGTMLSRMLGLVRVAVLAYAIGVTGLAADAFATSIKIPNTIYTLIVTGALTAVLVPQITKAALAKDGGQAYINKLVTLTIAGSVALIPVVAFITPWVIDLLGAGWSDPAQTRLATLMAFWLLPQIAFYSIFTVAGEVLNARSLFGPYAWAPVLNNVISIAGLLVFVTLYGADSDGVLSLERWNTLAIALVAGSATLGVAAQALVLFAFWKRAGLKFAFDFRFRGVGLGTMGKVAFWTFMTALVAQGVTLFQAAVLNLATGDGTAGLAAFEMVSLIFVLPHSIITISLVTANFTRMSEAVHAGDLPLMKLYLGLSARITVFAMAFFTALMIVLSTPIAKVILPDASDDRIRTIAILLVVNVICLVPYSLNFVLNRGFFVLSDTRTPFFIVSFVSALMVLAASLFAQQEPAMIAYFISFASSSLATLQTVCTFVLLRRRIGSFDGSALVLTFVQSLVAALGAASVGALTLAALGGISAGAFSTSSVLGAITASIVVTAAMAIAYLAIALLIRNHEAKQVAALARRLLRR